jgi:hypothetical protein
VQEPRADPQAAHLLLHLEVVEQRHVGQVLVDLGLVRPGPAHPDRADGHALGVDGDEDAAVAARLGRDAGAEVGSVLPAQRVTDLAYVTSPGPAEVHLRRVHVDIQLRKEVQGY